MTDDDTLVGLLLAEDPAAARQVLDALTGPATPLRHLVAALLDEAPDPHLRSAARLARGTRDRQLVALCAAHLAGESDRVAVLVRDHLVDHPDSLLAAWLASRVSSRPGGGAGDEGTPAPDRIQSSTYPMEHQE